MADRSVVYRLVADASGVLAGTRQASAATRKLADDVTKVGKEGDKARKSFDTLGRQSGRVALVAAAGLGVMVAKAANFEQAISNVAAATHETEENMVLLRKAALETGAATQYSASEAAGAITELAKAGVETADILGKNGALNGSLALAAAGELEVAEAAETMATALTQFQLPGEEAAHVADLLAAGAGKAQGSVSDMGNALKYAGVPASNLGVSIEETAGAIALFAKNGIIGEQAGTSLRGMLSSLTSPSKIAKKTLDELGISMFDQKGKFIGLAGVADQLQGNMKSLTDEERANALGKIFGNEQLQAANVLYREGGDAVRTWERNVDDAGFAAETAAIKTDNLRGDIERLGGAIDTALIKGGQGGQGFLRGLAQGATAAVDAFNKLPSSFSNTLSGMLAITAVTGGGLWFGSKVISGISDTRQALELMGPAGVKAGRAMKAVTGAAAGFGVLLVAVEGIKAIQRATAETLPGLGTMRKRLVDISTEGQIAVLGSQFDDLAGSIAQVNAATFKPVIGSGHIDISQTFLKPFSVFGIEDSGLTEAKAEIDLIDQGLASLVSNGRADVAAQALTNIGLASGLTSDELADLRSNLPGYQDALDGMATEATLAADAHEGMGKKVKIAGQTVHFTAEQIEAAQDSYDKARENAAGVASGFLDISKKADKAKVSLGEWIRSMEKQAIALEQFTANVKKAGDRGVASGLIAQLAELGPAGALRLKQLADGSDKEIDRANAAFKRGQTAVEDFVNATTTVPDELRTDVVVVDDAAKRKERALRQKFNTFPKSTNTQMKVDNKQALAGIRAVEARIAKAFRERVLKIRIEHNEVRLERAGGIHAATGGHIRGPGSATSDSIPAYLSNGEYVVRAAAVQRYGTAMFDRLNAMHFASGGQVGAGSGGGAGIDYNRLASALAQVRPLYGDVHVKDGSDFRRQLSQDRVRSSLDGVRR